MSTQKNVLFGVELDPWKIYQHQTSIEALAQGLTPLALVKTFETNTGIVLALLVTKKDQK